MNFIVVGILAALVLVGATARLIFKKTDNVVEEIAEGIIKDKTGYTVDLSPDTPDPSDTKIVEIISDIGKKGLDKVEEMTEDK